MSLLPLEKSQPKHSLADYPVLIHGDPGIGKSSFCAQIKDAIFLDFESGLNALEVYKTPLIATTKDKTGWDQFLDICTELIGGNHPFHTIVIDTVEQVYQLCLEHVCTKLGVVHPGDQKDFGKTWHVVNNEFYRVVTKLAGLPYGLFLLSHSKQVEVTTRTAKFMRTVPNLSEGARKRLAQTISIVMYFSQREVKDKEGNVVFERIIYCHPSLYHEAKSRVEVLKEVPEVMPMNYEKFEELFHKKEKEG